jgi:uroporphyrinogen decarboxylase
MPEHNFIAAAFGQPHDTVPIWIMRQAGRYLPQYREVRSRVSFLDLCHKPELMTEVTLQPIDIFGFDAAILFSDILIPLAPLGISVTFPNGPPKLEPPLREPADVDRLSPYDIADKLSFVLEGIRQIRGALNDRVPLIGFCGSPFTLLCYLIEGGGSKDFTETKKFIYTYPDAAVRLLSLLADLVGNYLKLQVSSGVQALQLFDTWGGILSPGDYSRFSLPYVRRVFELCQAAGIPRTLYLGNTACFLHLIADLNCEVISVDWRTDLTLAGRLLPTKAIQGNLDPNILFAPTATVIAAARTILETMRDRDGFIFNLGHGILPPTPTDNVRALVETVHTFRR